MDNHAYDENVKQIAMKLRKYRELKGLTRENFYEPLGENSDYWGLIERGEQSISLPKLLLICEAYNIPVESVIDLNYQKVENTNTLADIQLLLEKCNSKQLDIIKKFIEDIAMTI
ncbi:MAG: helix-turn-helix transcriptional regulator [Hungatella hathewayi]|nr:helix-turn-helix transcriptional regulator [Hungatella hathewayi]